MRGEEGVVESVEQAVRGGRQEGRLVIGGWHGATAVGSKGGMSVGAGRGAGGGAVGSC